MTERRKIADEREARRCLRAAARAGEPAGAWARAHGIDGRSLNAWPKEPDPQGTRPRVLSETDAMHRNPTKGPLRGRRHEVVRHPFRTGEGLVHAVINFEQTAAAIWQGIKKTGRAIASGDSETIGSAVTELGTAILPAGVLSKAAKADKVADLGKAAEAVDALADASKAADTLADAAKAADAVADASKTADTLTDAAKAAESATDASKAGDVLADASKTVDELPGVASRGEAGAVGDTTAASGARTSPYDPRRTRDDLEVRYGKENVTSTTVPPRTDRGVRLSGERHPAGIVYDQRGFPIFDDIAVADLQIPRAQIASRSYLGQMRATRQLRARIAEDPRLAQRFTASQLRAIEEGSGKIPGYTWHHHQNVGRM